MSNKQNLIAVMDIGSSKLSCMQCLKESNGLTKVLGSSIIATQGIKSGIITDFNLASDCISKVISECEEQSNENIKELSVSISSHQCFTKSIESKIKLKDEKVSQIDIKLCLDKALENSYLLDKKVLHISPTDYIIDQAGGITNPIEMYGNELEMKFLVTYIGINHYKNYVHAITTSNIDVHRIVFSNYASGLAVLNENELELGSVIVDMGARTTSIGMFSKNNFIYSDVLAFGGNNITEAIARKLSITFVEAEKLKVMYASVLDSSKEEEMLLEIPSINFENKENFIQISKRNLYEVVKPFYEELLKWVYNSIEKSGNADLIGRVLVFTGGSSQIDGLSILANNIYNFNTRIGIPKNIRFNFHNNLDASHSVAAGLIQNELNILNKNKLSLMNINKKEIEKRGNLSFIKQWVGEHFFN